MKGYLPGPGASSPVSGMLSFQSLDTLASASLANAARGICVSGVPVVSDVRHIRVLDRDLGR
jgi:hypothetical protein